MSPEPADPWRLPESPAAAASFREHVNPQYASVLKTIGFDRGFVRAEGAHLWDRHGNRYLDMCGGYAVANVGRNHPTVVRALRQTLDSGAANWVQFDTPPLAGALAAELKRRVGRELDRVFFTNSGTEGIEAAIKFARASTGRAGILGTEGAFHGLTTGSLAINGCPSFVDGFGPLLPGAQRVPFGSLDSLERVVSRRDIAAFVVEPVQGKTLRVAPPGYLAEAGRICRRHGTLLVIDEIQTGIGRTGRFLALDHEEGIQPDMLVLSKALSGCFVPVGAVLVRRGIWEKVFSSMDRAIVHSSTYHMGTLAMAAGLATLAALDADGLVCRAAAAGGTIAEGVEAMRHRFECLGPVRGRGLMLGIELREPRSVMLRATWHALRIMDPNLFAQAAIVPLMEDHRVLAQVSGHGTAVVKLTPPLCVSDEDVRWFLRAFEAVMEGLHRGPGLNLLYRLARNSLRPAAASPGVPLEDTVPSPS